MPNNNTGNGERNIDGMYLLRVIDPIEDEYGDTREWRHNLPITVPNSIDFVSQTDVATLEFSMYIPTNKIQKGKRFNVIDDKVVYDKKGVYQQPNFVNDSDRPEPTIEFGEDRMRHHSTVHGYINKVEYKDVKKNRNGAPFSWIYEVTYNRTHIYITPSAENIFELSKKYPVYVNHNDKCIDWYFI